MREIKIKDLWDSKIYDFYNKKGEKFHIYKRRECLYCKTEYDCVKVTDSNKMFSLVHGYYDDDIVYI